MKYDNVVINIQPFTKVTSISIKINSSPINQCNRTRKCNNNNANLGPCTLEETSLFIQMNHVK
jgi:hypothetical protein